MDRYALLLIALAIFFSSAVAAADDTAAKPAPQAIPSEADLRASVEKALPLLMRGAVGHRENRSCFSCHNQGVPIVALTLARSRGMAIDGEELHSQLEHIARFVQQNRNAFREGRGTGGKADTAGYALLALEAGEWQGDDSRTLLVEYLLKYEAERDHYPASSNRPPSEASPFTTSYLALRGLRASATADQRPKAEARIAQVLPWLEQSGGQARDAKVRDTEDRAFRLVALHAGGAGNDALREAADALLVEQQPDGGWRQIDSLPSDPYATATALVALHESGQLAADDRRYTQGLAYLLATQHDDGSWHVPSRSKPFQKYFETGFPHEKDQFISAAATAWAAVAMLHALP